jgi:hypothetical protein
MMIARVFSDAAALWRRDRDLWVRVAGVFFFLPALAIMLFAPLLDLSKVDEAAVNQMLVNWVVANAWWLLALVVWQVFAAGVVLVLALDPVRPRVSTAILRALRLLPALMLAYLATMLPVALGASFFIVPGFYVLGRTLLALPILVAEPGLGPFGAIIAAIRRSHRRGWILFFIPAGPFLLQNLIGSVIGALGDGLGAEVAGTPAHFLFGVVLAAVASAGALAQALLQAAAYREVGRTSNGI